MKKVLAFALGATLGATLSVAACAPQQPQYQAVCVNPFTHEVLDSELFCHAGFGEFVFVSMAGGYQAYATRTIVTHYVTADYVSDYRVQYPPKFKPAPKQRLAGKDITVYDPKKKAGVKLTGIQNTVKKKKVDPAWGTPPDPKKRQPSKIQDRPKTKYTYKPTPIRKKW